MRSLALCLALLTTNAALAFAQGPPLNGTPEELFNAGMNALSGSAGTRDNFSAVEYFRRSAQKRLQPRPSCAWLFLRHGANSRGGRGPSSGLVQEGRCGR